jgi:hypothetical protein
MKRNLKDLKCVRFDVFTMITMKFIILLDVMLYNLVEIYKFKEHPFHQDISKSV